MKKISIVGESKQFNFEEVKGTVVLLKGSRGDRYHWKSSPDLTKVGGRYFRKESPLIVKMKNGDYIFKKDAIKVEEGYFVHKDHGLHEVLNGKTYLKKNIVSVGSNRYHKEDDAIVNVTLNGKQKFIMKEDAIELSPWYYGENRYVSKELVSTEINSYQQYLSSYYLVAAPDKNIHSPGGVFARGDVRAYISCLDKSKKLMFAPRTEEVDSMLSPTRVYFSPKNLAAPSDLRNPIRVRIYASHENKVVEHADSGEVVARIHLKEYEKAWKSYYEAYVKGDTEAMRKRFNESFKDRDENENTAKIVKKDFPKYPGGRIADGMNFTKTQPFTNDLAKTGGVGYTFGVELEYSAGHIGAAHLKERNAALAGDGSVGGNEIVSGVLHGSIGMDEAESLCRLLNSNCFVDDRCGVHIHVGGKASKNVTTPNWGSDFNITAIKLGTILEEELFKILPESRNPYLKYCRGIKEFSDITPKSWRKQLGKFVFGQTHTWDDEDKNAQLGRWPAGRYKWLNLVNCATRGPIKTIEIRIWSGTTDWRKLRAFILLSLAFVSFVDNRRERVWSKEAANLTLMDIVRDTYQDREIVEFLEHFIEKRKLSFGRKKIYNNEKEVNF